MMNKKCVVSTNYLQYKHKVSNEFYYLITGEKQYDYGKAIECFRVDHGINTFSNEPVYIPVTINVICWHINEVHPFYEP
jgi:hypothetical protein